MEIPVSRGGGENQVLTADGKPILGIIEGSNTMFVHVIKRSHRPAQAGIC
jgi:hypothetical protein